MKKSSDRQVRLVNCCVRQGAYSTAGPLPHKQAGMNRIGARNSVLESAGPGAFMGQLGCVPY
jgi:hypothetical protein